MRPVRSIDALVILFGIIKCVLFADNFSIRIQGTIDGAAGYFDRLQRFVTELWVHVCIFLVVQSAQHFLSFPLCRHQRLENLIVPGAGRNIEFININALVFPVADWA